MGKSVFRLLHVPVLLFVIYWAPPATASDQCDLNAEDAAKILNNANAAYESQDLLQAEKLWLQVRDCGKTTPDWPKAVFNLGLLEHRKRNFNQAIQYFEEVLQSNPNDKETGGSIMETNRNYSYRSALAISQCREEMGEYWPALQYAKLAKTKYRYYSWCGTCIDIERTYITRRVLYLEMRATRAHLWGSAMVIGIVFWGAKGLRRRRGSNSNRDSSLRSE